jgi:hypothetical protein
VLPNPPWNPTRRYAVDPAANHISPSELYTAPAEEPEYATYTSQQRINYAYNVTNWTNNASLLNLKWNKGQTHNHAQQHV